MSKTPINIRKIHKAWAFYDWANSVYPMVITTAIFPIFYEKITTKELPNGATSDMVTFFGFEFVNTALISYISSAIFLTVSILVPLLSGMADYKGNKKSFLRLFYLLGSVSCMGLYFFNPQQLEWGLLIYFLAGIGFWASLVYYNAFLPEIAPPEDHDRLSAMGYAWGYFGSGLLLIICLALMMGLDMPAKWSFVITGIWWLGFATYSHLKMPETRRHESVVGGKVFLKGFQELRKVWKELNHLPRLKRYLASFFVFSMGIQTVMIMAVYFGTKEIAWASESEKTSGLITSVLVIQFVAIGGSHFLSWLSGKWGNVNALAFVLFLWCGICISALWVHTPLDFYITAGCVGLVMGGAQSLSRSTYSKLLPETQDTASYFSFYDVLEKLGIVVGVFSYGFIEEITGSMRNSIVALIVYFIVGLSILLSMPKEERIRLEG